MSVDDFSYFLWFSEIWFSIQNHSWIYMILEYSRMANIEFRYNWRTGSLLIDFIICFLCKQRDDLNKSTILQLRNKYCTLKLVCLVELRPVAVENGKEWQLTMTMVDCKVHLFGLINNHKYYIQIHIGVIILHNSRILDLGILLLCNWIICTF